MEQRATALVSGEMEILGGGRWVVRVILSDNSGSSGRPRFFLGKWKYWVAEDRVSDVSGREL